ncbi:MAG TPA: hypothetical protein VH415_05770 [Nitrososphaeraceae archaeon]
MSYDDRFMSELLSFREISLGKTEKYFLWLLLISPHHAYEICSYLKRTEKETDRQSMAYPNVRKRLVRLKKMGLIEEVMEAHRFRNAIKYKVTAHGLFQCFLMIGTDQGRYHIFPLYLKEHKENILLQNILYRYFEWETLLYFNTIPRAQFLNNYLRVCCEAILGKVESYRLSIIRDKKKSMSTENMNLTIAYQFRKFVFDIVSSSNIEKFKIIGVNEIGEEYVRFDAPGYNPNDPDFSHLWPTSALSKDKKFMATLKEIKNEFNDGCKNFTLGIQ